MTGHVFPEKPYDEVTSEFIRGEIRQGAFDDVAYRRYVNELVWIEWYTTDEGDIDDGGLPRFGRSVHRWKVAAMFPEAYDTIRRELDASTRDDATQGWDGEEDPQERRKWARQHRREWRAVQQGEQRSPEARPGLASRGYRPFAPFRFPVLPYDTVQSAFVREMIQDGDFDDMEHRRFVNKLVWPEWYATEWEGSSAYGPVLKNWRIAAKFPEEYDIVRRELGEETRDALEPAGEIHYGDIDVTARTRKHKRSWKAVQETVE